MKKLIITLILIFVSSLAVFAWRLPRWGYFPVNYYIEDHPKKFIIEKALQTWTNESNGLVTFKEKKSKLTSALFFKFEDKDNNYYLGKDSYILGLATQTAGNFIMTVNITIYLNSPDNNLPKSDEELYLVSIHEIGHALGLGHSDQTTDIMYPYYQKGWTTLSDNDINRLKEIYLPD